MYPRNHNPDIILLNGGIARHDGDWNWQNVNSPFARLYLVTEGRAKIYCRGEACDLTAGHMYMIPPFTLHSCECKGAFSLYYFHVYEQPSQRLGFLEEYHYPLGLPATAADSLLFDRLLAVNPGRELPRYDPRSYDNSDTLIRTITTNTHHPVHTRIESHGLMCQILSRFMEHAVPKVEIYDNRVYRALKYIRKNLHTKIALADMASLCSLSTDHFIRLFKKELGETPVDYINKCKIERAQLLLVTTDMLVKDIAYSLSCNNISYFNMLFKGIVGVTPREYRRGSLKG